MLDVSNDMAKVVNTNAIALSNHVEEMNDVIARYDKKFRLVGFGFILCGTAVLMNYLEHNNFKTRLEELEEKKGE